MNRPDIAKPFSLRDFELIARGIEVSAGWLDVTYPDLAETFRAEAARVRRGDYSTALLERMRQL